MQVLQTLLQILIRSSYLGQMQIAKCKWRLLSNIQLWMLKLVIKLNLHLPITTHFGCQEISGSLSIAKTRRIFAIVPGLFTMLRIAHKYCKKCVSPSIWLRQGRHISAKQSHTPVSSLSVATAHVPHSTHRIPVCMEQSHASAERAHATILDTSFCELRHM